MEFINVGNQVYINLNEIEAICPATSLSQEKLNKATDLSKGTKRTVIFTRNKDMFFVDLRFDTLRRRLGISLSEK